MALEEPRENIISDRKLVWLANWAGWTSTNDVITATAIAIAESGGNASALNDNTATGDESYGLWQINMLGKMGEERERLFGRRNGLWKPGVNAKAAYTIYGQQGFRAWSVYKSGSYLKFIARARAARKSPQEMSTQELNFAPESKMPGEGDPPFDPFDPGNLPDITAPFDAINDFFSFVGNPENWKRVAFFLGGIAVIWVSIILLAKQSGALGRAAKVASNVVPAARVVKKA